MKKKFIFGIILLMSISLIGIIAVQIVWIRNAIEIQSELFSRNVNQAMQSSVDRMNRAEDLESLEHMIVLSQTYGDSVSIVVESGEHNSPDLREDLDKELARLEEEEIQLKSDSLIHSGFLKNITQLNEKFPNTEKEGIEDIEIIHSDTLLNQDNLDSFNIDIAINIKNLKDMDSVLTFIGNSLKNKPAIHQTIEWKTKRLQSLANKLITELNDGGFQFRDTNRLQKIISEELAYNEINETFIYGIFKDRSMFGYQSAEDSILLSESKFKIPLFPESYLNSDYMLVMAFPGRNQHLIRSIGGLLALSVLFSLFILVTFGLSLYSILKQKKISEVKNDFINNMTHEFKTPLATIAVASDSINNPKVITDPEKISYFNSMIKKENLRMNRQVEDILTIARLEQKDFEFHWELLDINTILAEVIAAYQLQVEARAGHIKIINSLSNPLITSDKKHIGNAIGNLIDNAIKYSGGKPEIQISLKNTERGILLEVSDSGIGMSKSIQNRIFDRFYRQNSGIIHNVKGFGLGLSYIKAVVEANHGSIRVKSEVGKGSCFTLFLPFIIDRQNSDHG